MLKKTAILFLSLLTVVSILLTAACGSESKSPATQKPVTEQSERLLVPQKANILARISVESVLNDNMVREAYKNADKAPDDPATFDELLDEAKDSTGFDLRNFREAIIFGDIKKINEDDYDTDNVTIENYMGLIITGTFNKDELIASIEDATWQDLETESYNGYEIYSDSSSYAIDEESDAPNIAFLDDGILVIGSVGAIKDVIDVKNGTPGLSGDLIATFDNIEGSLGKMVMAVPDDWLSQMQDEEDLGALGAIDLTAFQDIKTLAASLDESGGIAYLEIRAGFSTSDSAQNAQNIIDSYINIFKQFFKMSDEEDKTPETDAIESLLNSVTLSISDNWLILDLELTIDLIEEVTPLLQETT